MYSVPNERNEREVRNHNLLIYLCADVNSEVKDLCNQFNIIYIMRTNVRLGKMRHLMVILVLVTNGL